MPPVRPLRVLLPASLVEALRAEARARHLAVGELVRRAVRADLRLASSGGRPRRSAAAPPPAARPGRRE